MQHLAENVIRFVVDFQGPGAKSQTAGAKTSARTAQPGTTRGLYI